MPKSQVTFVVGTSEKGLPAVIRIDRRVVEEFETVAEARDAIHGWQQASDAVESEQATRVQP